MLNDFINIIAISAETEPFKNERILNDAWAKMFPGALWIPVLARKLKAKNFLVTTADVALERVEQRVWDPQRIGIIQHADDHTTERLITLGCRPIVITAFESPLYAPRFYNNVKTIASKFPHRVMFSGLFKLLNEGRGMNHPVTFPSFNDGHFLDPVDWEKKDFLTMIVENKYNVPFSPLFLRHPWDILRIVKRLMWSLVSPDIMRTDLLIKRLPGRQLHDQRFEAILYFSKRNQLKLFGKGWSNLSNLPKYYSSRLGPLLRHMKPQFVDDKIAALRKFKFALCFENYSFPGYITEKIIDCFVAGVVPIYLGAPDIASSIPRNCYVDAAAYESFEELENTLTKMTKPEYEDLIRNGRNFLRSEEGRRYSFEGFAGFMQSLILNEINPPTRTVCQNPHASKII